MIIHEGYKNIKLRNPVVTLGYFDGVHRGHKYLLECLVKRAGEINGESVVVTLYPHPRKVLSGNKSDLKFLTSMDEKKVLLEKAGIDNLIIVPFTNEFSKKEACEFIKEILVDKIGMKQLFVGFNHHFGRGRGGDYNTILECAAQYGFKIERIKGITIDEGNISSTTIREALLKGELERANQLLGYDYFMNGTIVDGKHLGRSIGYPTANINPDYDDKLIPAFGVYAVEVILKGTSYKGMLNIGLRPTVNTGSEPRTIEVHLFDFHQDIYKSKITLIFRYRMRNEIKFDSIEELIKQMGKDKVEALRLLGSA